MRMRGKLLLTVLILVIIALTSICSNGVVAKTKIHPRNRMLISNGLVPPDILKYFPEVPKITPREALALYRAHKATFIAIGNDVPRLMDGWLLEDYMRFNPRRLRKYGIPTKGKLIIVY